MLWAAFTLAFFGFLRSSEFTYNGKFNIQSHLTRSDVHFYPNIVQPVSFEVVIKKSKTDPFRETAKLTIAKSNSTVCAVTALRDYLLQTNPSGATHRDRAEGGAGGALAPPLFYKNKNKLNKK